MEFEGARALVEIYSNIDVFMLVMIRVLGFMVIMPVFTGQTIPIMGRFAFAFLCAAVVMSSGAVTAPVTTSLLEYALAIISEFLTGFLIGFTCSLLFSIFHMIGQQTDFRIGFSMVSVHDPITQIQTPITGNLFYFVFLVFFVSQGGLGILMYYVLNTYELIPPGNAFILGNEGLSFTIIYLLSTYFELGVKFAMPIIAVTIIIDVALGILVKAVPQMNVFVVGMPLKVGAGIFTIFLLIPAWHNFIYLPFRETLLRNVTGVIRFLSG
ncbi:MAG: flagellar biosynthetic protein FliR [Defluviitaleaceae bacterium]|nr:flagellar biosynthetic protein FliR [Defluviitaleaceae bacterium]MCL2835851.1 flagellar biosynthetic protein FliR [Defluviitaleaceae bacterium]